MRPIAKQFSRAGVMTSIVAAGVLVWIGGVAAQQRPSTFMGGTPSVVDSAGVRTSRLKFPAGTRSNWHTHPKGQLLMIEQGRGLTQVRNGPLLEMMPGVPWWTPAGVEHWHGSAPDVDSIQLTIYEGDVTWLEAVPDSVYKATPRKP